MKDWVAWHSAYDEHGSALRERLDLVTGHLARALDRAPPGQIRLLSLCAGQGRDVLQVLPGHPRKRDVAALLVESNPANVGLARQKAADAGLSEVRVREADASFVASFDDRLPVDVLLLAGIFGNVNDADIKRTIDAAPALCTRGATVIWTRHRRPPDVTGPIRSWFASAGFDEVAFDELESESLASLGVHRLARECAGRLPDAGDLLFTFGSHLA